jgi:Fur family ferric uptake transcriptional regulator
MSEPALAPRPRSTRQRAAVLAALKEADRFRSAQDLHTLLKRRGDAIGLTTDDRTLQVLTDAGDVDVLRTDEGESLYRLCRGGDRHHHHLHLVCRRCGRTVEVEDTDVDRWAHRLAESHGYSDVSHNVEIYGICEACAI